MLGISNSLAPLNLLIAAIQLSVILICCGTKLRLAEGARVHQPFTCTLCQSSGGWDSSEKSQPEKVGRAHHNQRCVPVQSFSFSKRKRVVLSHTLAVWPKMIKSSAIQKQSKMLFVIECKTEQLPALFAVYIAIFAKSLQKLYFGCVK